MVTTDPKEGRWRKNHDYSGLKQANFGFPTRRLPGPLNRLHKKTLLQPLVIRTLRNHPAEVLEVKLSAVQDFELEALYIYLTTGWLAH